MINSRAGQEEQREELHQGRTVRQRELLRRLAVQAVPGVLQRR